MRSLIVFALALSLGAATAQAEACNPRLLKYATIPFTSEDDGRNISLPATLGDRSTRLELDTGAHWSVVSRDLAEALALTPRKSQTLYLIDASGKEMTEYVEVPITKIGPLNFGEAQFFVGTSFGNSIDEFGGLHGQNLLTQVNLEIDNAGKSISLYAQDHCPEMGVHWADEAVVLRYKRQRPRIALGSRIRPKIDKNQIDPPIVLGNLEGEEVSILFDTGATHSAMDEGLARRRFNVSASTPGARPAGKVSVGSGNTVDTFSYTFKSLTISGIQFSNVTMLIGKFDDNQQLILGMNEMRHLHLYFDFKEGAIYATAADAGKAPPAK